VDYETGLRVVEELKAFVPVAATPPSPNTEKSSATRASQPPGTTLAQLALRWILMFPAVTCAIPGAKHPAQVQENIAAATLPRLSPDTMKKIQALYDRQIRPRVHQYW
jgi:aryl-alcohol dehydrogenase-like predicted oxidoreductase